MAADCCSSSQPTFQKTKWNGHNAATATAVSVGILNSRRTAEDEASEAKDSAVDATAVVSDWAQTAAAKTGRKMEERMVSY